MARRPVIEAPDPRLRRRSRPVTDYGTELERLADDLIDTLHASSSAIGLSAPQVDDPRRVLVMDLSEDRCSPRVFVNPEILRRAGLGRVEESCLSMPDTTVWVWRSTRVLVRANDVKGNSFETTLDGLSAVILQHEMDHFAGKLLVDHMGFFRRRRWKRSHPEGNRSPVPAS
jgi:peptide deformylase